ncbi:hypothetical protein DL98DRAFT_171041 [Cadophora sp. DSE1049]|nr:hypothetical protein DL98DRAFT_171041 [Cadophora sp. DSE1049]
MALPRPSNLDRARWRTECREKLSELISKLYALTDDGFCLMLIRYNREQARISIDPSEVRLITRVEDPYSWQSLPARTHLFEKNLSKHSIGAYMELCREVGVSSEAVAKDVCKLIVPKYEANVSARIIFSLDQQQSFWEGRATRRTLL